jgi:hypothetical protein
MTTLAAAISCAAVLLGQIAAPPHVQENRRVDTALVDVFVIDAVPTRNMCERALRAAGLPPDLVCYAVTGRLGDDVLVIIPGDASDRVKLIEGLRLMSLYSREPIPTLRVYARLGPAPTCAWLAAAGRMAGIGREWTMKLELSRAGSSSGEMATLAILTALIETLPVGQQRTVLARAAALLPDGSSGTRRDEARRIIGAMLEQVKP